MQLCDNIVHFRACARERVRVRVHARGVLAQRRDWPRLVSRVERSCVAYLKVLVDSVKNEPDGGKGEHGGENSDHGLLAGCSTSCRRCRCVGHNHLTVVTTSRRGGWGRRNLRFL